MSEQSKVLCWMLLLLVAACSVWYCADQDAKSDCERKGGDYVRIYRGSVCLKPGMVVK